MVRGVADIVRGVADVMRGVEDVVRAVEDVVRAVEDVVRGVADVVRGVVRCGAKYFPRISQTCNLSMKYKIELRGITFITSLLSIFNLR